VQIEPKLPELKSYAPLKQNRQKYSVLELEKEKHRRSIRKSIVRQYSVRYDNVAMKKAAYDVVCECRILCEMVPKNIAYGKSIVR